MLFGPPLPGPPTDAGYYTFTEILHEPGPELCRRHLQLRSFNSIRPSPTVTVGGGPFAYNGSSHGATVSAVGIDGVTPVVGTAMVTYNGSTNVPSVAGIYAVHADFSQQ